MPIKRLYRVSNTSKSGWWVVAADEAEAVEVSLAAGRVRAAGNATLRDVTDFELAHNRYNLPDVLEGPSGIAARRIEAITGTELLASLRDGRPPEPFARLGNDRWLVHEVHVGTTARTATSGES